MLQIPPALRCAPFVAGLVLGGDQGVGAATPFVRQVKVARRASDALLDVGPPILSRLRAPLLLIRRSQERAQSTAIAAVTFECVGPGPIPGLAARALEPRIDPACRSQEIDDEARLLRRWPSPGVDLLPLGEVARQRIYQDYPDLLQVARHTRRRRDAAPQRITAGAEIDRSFTPDNSDQQIPCARSRNKGGDPHDRPIIGRNVMAFGGQTAQKRIDALHVPKPDLQIEHSAGLGVVVCSPGRAWPGAQHVPRKLIGFTPEWRLIDALLVS